MSTDSFMVASTDTIPVPTAWQPPGQTFSGTDVRSGQLQLYNYLNPAEIQAWEVKARAHLEERGCLDAITQPRAKDLSTFSAENALSGSASLFVLHLWSARSVRHVLSTTAASVSGIPIPFSLILR